MVIGMITLDSALHLPPLIQVLRIIIISRLLFCYDEVCLLILYIYLRRYLKNYITNHITEYRIAIGKNTCFSHAHAHAFVLQAFCLLLLQLSVMSNTFITSFFLKNHKILNKIYSFNIKSMN